MQMKPYSHLFRGICLSSGSAILCLTLYFWWHARAAETFREAMLYNQRTSLWALISTALLTVGYVLDRKFRKSQNRH